jgi:hypothetical protein
MPHAVRPFLIERLSRPTRRGPAAPGSGRNVRKTLAASDDPSLLRTARDLAGGASAMDVLEPGERVRGNLAPGGVEQRKGCGQHNPLLGDEQRDPVVGVVLEHQAVDNRTCTRES